MIDPKDMEACREAIRHGSLSFHTASKLLPARVRDPALALYAFCRLADDAVDLGDDETAAVLSLQERLNLAYEGRPKNTPYDRAFAAMVEEHEMPRALPEALLEGLAWDALGKEYQTLSGVFAYSARVAAAVGAMMTVLMGVRDANALARACDLGVAMQLTNIARDVGEDARMGRIYLPRGWFAEAGLEPDVFLADPLPTPEVRRMVKRLLSEADRLYLRAEAGVPQLPRSARPGITAARLVYAGIGSQIRANGFDSISHRAVTTKRQKLGWVGQAVMRSAAGMLMPQPATLYARPLPEVAFLVDAAATPASAPSRTSAVLDVLAELRAREAIESRVPQLAPAE
ncbi:MAG: phytoene/squalene synthase family protein [Rhodobacteraceae bacterium]|nr:phytoene/squalene synthase family protein [Paracoccaceae bacterium]